MKKRFVLLNITILFLFGFMLIAGQYVFSMRDADIGVSALNQLSEEERECLNKLASIKLSVYSTQTNELNQVRTDIMAKFEETDFESIKIQPKAAFIDSLLYDSKLKEYMNSSNLKRSNQSLLNKMKLYLPNELFVSFLANSQAIDQIFSIEEYLLENDYNFIGGSSIPTVKSKVKHYYYDKPLFKELVTELSEIAEFRDSLSTNKLLRQITEFGLLFALFILITSIIQLLDYYLFNINMVKIKFLLKGHINPRRFKKHVISSKTISLIIILVLSLLCIILDFTKKIDINVYPEVIFYIAVIALSNLVIFIFKKERIEL